MIPFIDLAAQQARIAEDLRWRMDAVLAHGKYILGPEVAQLEERLADYVGVGHCITVANGTDALQIALMALGVGHGDEVIVPSFSYIATAETVALLGAVPVYADVDRETCLMNPQQIEPLISERTRAIIPVSLYGQCADMAAIHAIAASHDLPVIEDGAQSFGATQQGKKSCALSAIGCTSFFPSKPLGCYGDGGALFTDDGELAKRLRQIARHGQEKRYHHVRVGVNSRLDTLQAAVLLAKLEVFDAEIEQRNAAAKAYDERLLPLGLELPKIAAGNISVWAQYTLRTPNRDALMTALKARGVPTMVHYPLALHQQPAVAQPADCPVSTQLADSVLSLPMHPYLETATIDAVCEALAAALQEVSA